MVVFTSPLVPGGSSRVASCGARSGAAMLARGPSNRSAVIATTGHGRSGAVRHARARTSAGLACGDRASAASTAASAASIAAGLRPASPRAAASIPTRSPRNGSRLSQASRISTLLQRRSIASAARACIAFCRQLRFPALPSAGSISAASCMVMVLAPRLARPSTRSRSAPATARQSIPRCWPKRWSSAATICRCNAGLIAANGTQSSRRTRGSVRRTANIVPSRASIRASLVANSPRTVVKSGGEAGVVARSSARIAARTVQNSRFKGKRASGGWGRRPQTLFFQLAATTMAMAEMGFGAQGPSCRRQKIPPFTSPARR